MKLVVSYSTGDGYTYCCQCDVPVEYESAEKLLVDLEDAVNRYLAAQQLQRDRQAEFEREHGSFRDFRGPNSKKRDEWFEKYRAFYETNRLPDENAYRIGRLHTSHFIEDGKFVAPNIYTIDEWFAAGDRGDLE